MAESCNVPPPVEPPGGISSFAFQVEFSYKAPKFIGANHELYLCFPSYLLSKYVSDAPGPFFLTSFIFVFTSIRMVLNHICTVETVSYV